MRSGVEISGLSGIRKLFVVLIAVTASTTTFTPTKGPSLRTGKGLGKLGPGMGKLKPGLGKLEPGTGQAWDGAGLGCVRAGICRVSPGTGCGGGMARNGQHALGGCILHLSVVGISVRIAFPDSAV